MQKVGQLWKEGKLYMPNAVVSIDSLQAVIKLLQEGRLRDRVKIVIGGEATFQKLADELVVDSWGGDVLDTVEKVKTLIDVVG